MVSGWMDSYDNSITIKRRLIGLILLHLILAALVRASDRLGFHKKPMPFVEQSPHSTTLNPFLVNIVPGLAAQNHLLADRAPASINRPGVNKLQERLQDEPKRRSACLKPRWT
jgi:hypothetical protein